MGGTLGKRVHFPPRRPPPGSGGGRPDPRPFAASKTTHKSAASDIVLLSEREVLHHALAVTVLLVHDVPPLLVIGRSTRRGRSVGDRGLFNVLTRRARLQATLDRRDAFHCQVLHRPLAARFAVLLLLHDVPPETRCGGAGFAGSFVRTRHKISVPDDGSVAANVSHGWWPSGRFDNGS